ncbi:MAG: PAS domain S-box protein [Nitrospirae bacterium]|nr:PAS domain S-box protein [Nitrospirota bacterium]
MSEMIRIAKDELSNLQERTTRLAQEKSCLQIINHMMMKLSETPGLENTIENMLRAVLDTIGGTNLIVYAINRDIYYADVFGRAKKVEAIDDPQVNAVLQKRAAMEYEHDFSNTLMNTPEFTRAWTWVVPLVVGSDIVGVIKMENLHMDMRELRAYLPAFFNYAAVILKNEMLRQSTLKRAYDELSKSNEVLEKEIIEHKRAEMALIGEREFSRSLLESMADGVVACDAEGSLTLFNRTARQWHGMDPRKLPPEEWAKHYDLYRSDGVTPLLTEEIPLARAFKGEIVVDAGMAIVVKGRTARFILANGSVIRDESGRKIGAVVVMRDVTELRRVEEKLRRANEELEKRVIERTAELHKANEDLQLELEERKRIEARLLVTQFSVDRSADIIFWIRPDGSYSYWNRAACELLGYSDDDFLHLKTCDLNPEHTGVAWQEHWEELRRCRFLRFETLLTGKDGRRIPVEITANHVEFNEKEYNCAYVRDITGRRRAEEALKKSEERFRRLAENARDVIYRMSLPDGRYEYMSPAAAELSGYAPEEFYASPQLIRKIIPPDWHGYFEEQWSGLLQGDMPPTYEFPIIHKSGEIRWINQRNILIRDEGGSIIAIEGIITDISERKRVEDELHKLNDELEQRVKERTAELQQKNAELGKMNKLFVGRELRMKELKEKIKELEGGKA